jgi:hypothetical protein
MEKRIVLIVLFSLVQINCISQNLIGKIIDSITLKPIAYVNITYVERNLGTNTNENGEFSLNDINVNKKLQISHVGYLTKKINLSVFKEKKTHLIEIKLISKQEELEEIIITHIKKKYSSNKNLGISKNLKIRTGFPLGYEFSNYIKNPYNKKGKLVSIILNLNKRKEYDNLCSYNIKFYKYDEINKSPGEEMFFENLIIHPQNKSYKLKIDVEDLNIDFEKNGICIGVTILDTSKKKLNETMSKNAPYINFTLTEKEILTWTRFRDKQWKVATTKSPTNEKYINSMINIDVKIEK